ncbi:MAG: Fumarate hydratase, alpha subunit [Clostridiales bacterium 38_11]|nr:MAG: Fumarate hydratase, alpha subunit [Clostridiales bacterium 38_11]HBH12035.1 fumarate hydratase [Clostridiales bacterium]
MRNIDTIKIKNAVKSLFIQSSYDIGERMLGILDKARENEENETARYVLDQIIENDHIARDDQVPMCQDTGIAVVFLEIGHEICFVGEPVEEAINQGVREAYLEAYLRKSIVSDPLFIRQNTNDNTPAVIHYEFTRGNNIRITVAAKGFGSENMSQIRMMKPADGVAGVKSFVLECVRKAGSNPCPPIIVGVGIGGSFEKAAILSKKALTREIGELSVDKSYRELEMDLLNEVNSLGIGPAGLKGKTTCLAVHINYFPTHIAGMPVAVNIGCHAYRHATTKI